MKFNQEFRQAYSKASPTNRLHIRLVGYQVILQAAITLTLLWLVL